MFQAAVGELLRTHYFIFNNFFFPKIVLSRDKVEKRGRGGLATHDSIIRRWKDANCLRSD